jgi:hypothetical protein
MQKVLTRFAAQQVAFKEPKLGSTDFIKKTIKLKPTISTGNCCWQIVVFYLKNFVSRYRTINCVLD